MSTFPLRYHILLYYIKCESDNGIVAVSSNCSNSISVEWDVFKERNTEATYYSTHLWTLAGQTSLRSLRATTIFIIFSLFMHCSTWKEVSIFHWTEFKFSFEATLWMETADGPAATLWMSCCSCSCCSGRTAARTKPEFPSEELHSRTVWAPSRFPPTGFWRRHLRSRNNNTNITVQSVPRGLRKTTAKTSTWQTWVFKSADTCLGIEVGSDSRNSTRERDVHSVPQLFSHADLQRRKTRKSASQSHQST